MESPLSDVAALSDELVPPTSIFADEDNDQESVCDDAIPSVNSAFAQQHAVAFDSHSCFESRKSCLRLVMKCVVAAEHSKNPSLAVQDIHRQKGRTVLGVVEVRLRYVYKTNP